MEIKDKVMLITGAGSGIGQALAVSAACEGARVAMCDISKRQMVEELSKKEIYDFGDIDILVNNAGVASSGMVCESEYELYEWTLGIIFFWSTVHDKSLPCFSYDSTQSLHSKCCKCLWTSRYVMKYYEKLVKICRLKTAA